MLAFWNRRELFSTFDQGWQAEARRILAEAGIPTRVKVVNRGAPSPWDAGGRARSGSLGERLEHSYEYTLYVPKADHGRAWALVRGLFG